MYAYIIFFLYFLEDEASKSDNLSESDKCDDDEDTSDEELFNPVAFLSDNRVKSEIRTPEKVISPITGSPLTPISPYVAQPKNEGARLKYSLDKLLLEKPKQVEKDKALAKLQLAMQQAIEAGRWVIGSSRWVIKAGVGE